MESIILKMITLQAIHNPQLMNFPAMVVEVVELIIINLKWDHHLQ